MNAKLLALLFVMLLPAVASATYITTLDATADCMGWSVDATVRFRVTSFEADAIMVVELQDLEGNVFETQTQERHLSREDPSYQTQVYNFNGEWTYYGPAGRYRIVATMTISAPYPNGIDEDELTRNPKFDCAVVSTEETTWSSVKGLYR